MLTKGELVAAAKRVSPLNNPVSEKANSAYKSQNEREKGDSKGGKGRVQPAEAIVRCQMCGRLQKIVFALVSPPERHKCIWCNQLQPMDGYHVLMYGLRLPRVLAPHEVEVENKAIALGR